MVKLNCLQYKRADHLTITNDYSVSALVSNEEFDALCLRYYKKFEYPSLKTFSLLKEGFLGLFLELEGKIAVSVGETQAVIDGAKLYEKLGFEIQWVNLKKDGTVNLYDLKDKNIDFLFLSSYVMDTFAKIDLKRIKRYTKAKIISNGTAHKDTLSDAIYFDNYKLTGFSVSAVLLFKNDLFELLPVGQIDSVALKICYDALEKQNFNNNMKPLFIEHLLEIFNDDICFFVNHKRTLPYSLHFGLKYIKARELIRTMALNKIYITNGEGCSLGFSKPSRIVQEMGYDETRSRCAISLSFDQELTPEEIKKVVETMYKKYKQIRALNN